MVRRGKRAAFMADAFVFPGGRVDDDDASVAFAAVREAFEEAGVLLAVSSDGASALTDASDWAISERRALVAKQTRFAEILARRALTVDPSLVRFARWVTPSSEPRRYDTHFFLGRMPAGQTPLADDLEVSEHRWGTARALLEAGERGDIKLPPPTFWHLRDLANAALTSVEQALAWGRAQPDVTIRPKLIPIDATVAVVLPWDPEFPSLPGEGEVLAHPPGDITRFLLDDGRWRPIVQTHKE